VLLQGAQAAPVKLRRTLLGAAAAALTSAAGTSVYARVKRVATSSCAIASSACP